MGFNFAAQQECMPHLECLPSSCITVCLAAVLDIQSFGDFIFSDFESYITRFGPSMTARTMFSHSGGTAYGALCLSTVERRVNRQFRTPTTPAWMRWRAISGFQWIGTFLQSPKRRYQTPCKRSWCRRHWMKVLYPMTFTLIVQPAEGGKCLRMALFRAWRQPIHTTAWGWKGTWTSKISWMLKGCGVQPSLKPVTKNSLKTGLSLNKWQGIPSALLWHSVFSWVHWFVAKVHGAVCVLLARQMQIQSNAC